MSRPKKNPEPTTPTEAPVEAKDAMQEMPSLNEIPRPEDAKTPSEGVQPVKSSLTAQISDINEKLDALTGRDKETKKKLFKMPWKVKGKMKKLHKKNRILYLKLLENKTADLNWAEIKGGMVNIDGILRDASPSFTYWLQGKYPLIIQPSWDVLPLGTKQFLEEMDTPEKKNAYEEKFIIRAVERSQVEDKKFAFNWKILLLIGGAILVLWWVFFGGDIGSIFGAGGG